MSDPRKQEVYISIDLESDGPTPMKNSMLSLGATAFSADGKKLGHFYKKLEPLPGHAPNPNTMKWWNEPAQQAAWEEATKDPEDPKQVMQDFADWLNTLTGKPILTAYPAAFEGMWIQCYFDLFGIENPLRHNGIDVRSYAMGALGCNFAEAAKPNFLVQWQSKHPHTHAANDDAIEQGETFINMKNWRERHALVEKNHSVSR